MQYRCPLCLLELQGTDRLVRFCTEHPGLVEIFNALDTERLYCQAPECTAHTSAMIERGVFLLHLGCSAKHPFLHSDGSVSIAGSLNDGNKFNAEIMIGAERRNLDILHWLIYLLREAPKTVTNALGQSEKLTEMWFPLLLLLAASKMRTANGQHIGSLISLVGAPMVGKTVLNMQAMDKQGYERKDTPLRNVKVKNYIYCHQPEGSTEPIFLESLYLRSIMERNLPGLFLPNPTPPGPGDLKAVFIKPAKRESPPQVASRPKGIWERLKAMAKWIRSEFSAALVAERLAETPLYTAIFYDTAGEIHANEAGVIRKIEAACDRFAVLISAEEVLGASGDSLSIALQRLNTLTRMGEERVAVVVTKIDSIREQLGDDWQKVFSLAEDLIGDRQKEARRLLRGWLVTAGATNRENREELARMLDRGLPVFFVWTENWPERQTGDQQPVSYGLVRFMLWCLGVSWPDINQPGQGD